MNNLDSFIKYVEQNKYVNESFKLHLRMYVEFFRKIEDAPHTEEQARTTANTAMAKCQQIEFGL